MICRDDEISLWCARLSLLRCAFCSLLLLHVIILRIFQFRLLGSASLESFREQLLHVSFQSGTQNISTLFTNSAELVLPRLRAQASSYPAWLREGEAMLYIAGWNATSGPREGQSKLRFAAQAVL